MADTQMAFGMGSERLSLGNGMGGGRSTSLKPVNLVTGETRPERFASRPF